jgi:hypothetical protein
VGAKSAGAEKGSRDLYEVLEVASTASDADIRAAFRRLAAAYHPDRNPDDARAALMFKRVNAAYQVLSDAEKRATYDQLTEPIADADADARPRDDTPDAEPPKRERRRSNKGAQPPPPVPEREVLRDGRVVVTNKRITVIGAGERLFSELRAVRLLSRGRNHYIPLAIVFALIAVAALRSVVDGRWTTIALVGLAGFFGRYVFTSPRFVVRLVAEPGVESDIQAPSLAWARDVVRAVDEGIAHHNPRAYLGGQHEQSMHSAGAQFGEAVGGCLGLIVAALVVGAMWGERHGPMQSVSSTMTGSPPPVATPDDAPSWFEVDLGDILVTLPGMPNSSMRTEIAGGNVGTIQERVVKRGESTFALVIVDFPRVASWNAVGSVDGAVEEAIKGVRATPGVVDFIPVSDRRRSLGWMPGREVVATLPMHNGSRAGFHALSYSRWARTYGVVTIATPAEQENAERVVASIRLKATAGTKGLAGSKSTSSVTAASATPGARATTTQVRTWRCADGTLKYGTKSSVCDEHGGVDPISGAPIEERAAGGP